MNSTAINQNQTTTNLVAQSMPTDLIVYTSLCVFGVLTNLVNVIVFMSPKLKDNSFSFMLANSLADLIFLAISAFHLYISCGILCSSRFSSLGGQIFFVYIANAFLTSFAMFILVNETFILVQRYALIRNRTFFKNVRPVIIMSCIYLICLIYTVPSFFIRRIILLPNNMYFFENTDFFNSTAGQILVQITRWIRIVFSVGVLSG